MITAGQKATAQDLLSVISQKWTSTPDGGLQSSDFRIGSYEAALIQLLNMEGTNLLPSEFQTVASKALRRMCKAGGASNSDYEAAFAEVRDEVIKRRPKKHFALTRCYFGVYGDFELKLKLWDHNAVLTNSPDSRLDLSEFFISGYGHVNLQQSPAGLYLFTGPLMARSAGAALDLASQSNRAILGLIAFWMNLGKFSLFIGHERRLTKIIPGKEVVIYDSKCSRNVEMVSYYISTPDKCESFGGKSLDRLKAVEKVFDDVSKSHKSKRDYIINFLQLYYDAVSEQSTHDQISKLWKAAEFATFSQGSSTDQIAKRISIAFPDFDLAFAVCSAVGHRRHQIIHSEKQGQHMAEIVELFREIIESFFRVALWSKIPNLKAWRAALEVGSSRYSKDTLQAALPILALFDSSEN